MLGSKYWRAASVLVAGSMVLAACGNATPQVIKETVVVNQTSVATVEVTKEVQVTAAPEATARTDDAPRSPGHGYSCYRPAARAQHSSPSYQF